MNKKYKLYCIKMSYNIFYVQLLQIKLQLMISIMTNGIKELDGYRISALGKLF